MILVGEIGRDQRLSQSPQRWRKGLVKRWSIQTKKIKSSKEQTSKVSIRDSFALLCNFSQQIFNIALFR